MAVTALKLEDLPHYTYDDYVQWEGRWELIHGIPYAMVPMPKIKHQRMSGKIYRYLSELLDNCRECEVLLPVDWQIYEDTVVQPDVLVVSSGSIENMDEEKLSVPPVMVFEVLSPSTARKDRFVKYKLYEDQGVKYYCIVDPDTKSAEVFELNRESFQKKEPFKDGKMVFELGKCEIEFDFGKVFK